MGNSGIVYLVGAGPGDPDLLTVKAHRLLQSADIVFYDHLVSDEVMDLIPEGVECVSVPRSTGKYCVPQSEINNLLVELANKGKLVVRLKCGDPYMFGRGSEEAQYLLKNGIRFKAVPGVTSATGFSVYSGIPLTHRGLSNSVRVITGHQTDNQGLVTDWKKTADPNGTLVVYMGLGNLPHICDELETAGLDPSTPAAAIHDGTLKCRKRVISTLSHLASDVEASGLKSPVMLIIGKVVSLSSELDWFESELVTEQAIESH